MRLICPNCGAQYEVPDDVIPDGGRDVQCSNCAHTWFEKPGDSETFELSDAGISIPEVEVEEPVAPPPPVPPRATERPAPAAHVAPPVAPEYDDYEDEDDDDDFVAPSGPRRSIDPDVAEILKAEAEREAERRSANPEPEDFLETQTELGLEEPSSLEERRAAEARARMARLRGEQPVDPDTPRRDLLPDIEEINSTLRPASDRAENDPSPAEAVQDRRRGFRTGFFGMILIAAVAVAVYVLAAQIAMSLPAAEPYLDSYVVWVDGLRNALDVWVQGLLAEAA